MLNHESPNDWLSYQCGAELIQRSEKLWSSTLPKRSPIVLTGVMTAQLMHQQVGIVVMCVDVLSLDVCQATGAE